MCLYPISMYKCVFFHEGELKCRMTREVNSWYLDHGTIEKVEVKCGKCIECLAARANEWTCRILAEASLYDDNCFLTLTYADNPVNLIKSDLQKFIKRLRKFLEPKKIRYFACGEYGSKGNRPHYHLIIFNWKPSDLEFFYKSGLNNIYKSQILSKIWNRGFVSVGDISAYSAMYCAKYLQKLNVRQHDVDPFLVMSNHPGIGLEYFKKNLKSLETDSLYFEGVKYMLPRYFLDYAKRELSFDDFQLKNRRLLKFLVKNCNITDLAAKRLNLISKCGIIKAPKRYHVYGIHEGGCIT